MSKRDEKKPRGHRSLPLSASGRGQGGWVNVDGVSEPGGEVNPDRDEHLRSLLTTAYPPEYPSREPSAALWQRVAEERGRRSVSAPPGRWHLLRRVAWQPVGAAAGAVLLTLLGVGLARWEHRASKAPVPPPTDAPHRIVRYLPEAGSPTRPHASSNDPVDHDTPRSARVRLVGSRRPHRELQQRPAVVAPPPQRPILPSPRHPGDDLALVNGDLTPMTRQWEPLVAREANDVEARVRHAVSVRDDFVGIPFPRLASTSDRQIAQAVESYKREAAIVDARLAREVTLEQRATALVDLCERLRGDTGIQLATGQSVADEKVTVFCRKVPLRDVMRQLSRPFGYTWLRSGKAGDYRYELVQDLRSQLLEEELRNRDRNEALLALEQELDRYRPYLHLTPDEIVARARTAPAAEKKLLEKLGGGDPRSGLGWGPIQMYSRLSPQELAALRAGEKLYFSEGPRPGERPLPTDVARGVLQSWRQERILKVTNELRVTDDMNDPDGLPVRAVPELRASVTLSLDRSELGQYGLEGLSGFFDRAGTVRRADSSGPYVIGRSPRVLQPDNATANARLAQALELRRRVALEPKPSCPAIKLPLPASGDRSRRREATPGAGGEVNPTPEPKVTTADALEALYRATGMPIVADSYTRLYKPAELSLKNRPLFEALNAVADRMRLRWSRERDWLQFRSTSFYDDRLKEVPNRLLERWATARRQQGMLTLEDLVEIAELSNAQLRAQEMADGARECWGLAEWDLARNGLVLPNLRFLAQFTPAQQQEAMGAAGLPFTRMTLAQQQGFLARAFPATVPGTGSPDTVPGIRSPEDLAGAALRVDYQQPGWFEWRPAGPSWLRWILPTGPGPSFRRVFRPVVRERTREAAVQALRGVDREVRETARSVAVRVDPRLEAGFPAEEAQIVPTGLELTTIYLTGATSPYKVTIVSQDGWGRPMAR
jgi:hypothetical protein